MGVVAGSAWQSGNRRPTGIHITATLAVEVLKQRGGPVNASTSEVEDANCLNDIAHNPVSDKTPG